MTYKTYEVHFTVELDRPPTEETCASVAGNRNLELRSKEFGYLYVPIDAEVTELKPVFEPGYFIDMSLPDEERQLYFGDTPRYVDWFDEEPLQGEGANWVRVNVTDMNF